MKSFLKEATCTYPFESSEYTEELSQFASHLKTLHKLEHQLEAWIKHSKHLKVLAVEIGETLKTTDLDRMSRLLDEDNESERALSSIKSKISLLQQVDKQHKWCRDLSSQYDKVRRKFEIAQKFEKSSISHLNDLKEKEEELKNNCMKFYKQVYYSLKFINTMNKDELDISESESLNSIPKKESSSCFQLIKHELNAFRISQFNYLLNCQKLLSGDIEENHINYDVYQIEFLEKVQKAFHEDRVKVLKNVKDMETKIESLESDDDEEESDMYRMSVKRDVDDDMLVSCRKLPPVPWDKIEEDMRPEQQNY